MKVLVCGGRRYPHRDLVYRALDHLHRVRGITSIVHGAAGHIDRKTGEVLDGADLLAGAWARDRGIPEAPYPADWDAFGRGAGPIRNLKMLNMERPDRLVAFSGGDGTNDMLTKWAAYSDVPPWRPYGA